jgi:hypothetical protein
MHRSHRGDVRRAPTRPAQATGKAIFSNETIESLRELGAALADVRRRLLAEGYTVKSGNIDRNAEAPNELCDTNITKTRR